MEDHGRVAPPQPARRLTGYSSWITYLFRVIVVLIFIYYIRSLLNRTIVEWFHLSFLSFKQCISFVTLLFIIRYPIESLTLMGNTFSDMLVFCGFPPINLTRVHVLHQQPLEHPPTENVTLTEPTPQMKIPVVNVTQPPHIVTPSVVEDTLLPPPVVEDTPHTPVVEDTQPPPSVVENITSEKTP